MTVKQPFSTLFENIFIFFLLRPTCTSLHLSAAVWNFPSPGGAAVLREMVTRRMKRKARRGRVNAV